MKRSGSLRRKVRVKPINKKRRAVLFTKHFHSTGYLTYVHGLDCCVGRGCAGPIQAAHVQSRGAGGTYESIVPMCSYHHNAQHSSGIESFQRQHALDLKAIAAETWTRFQKIRGEA